MGLQVASNSRSASYDPIFPSSKKCLEIFTRIPKSPVHSFLELARFGPRILCAPRKGNEKPKRYPCSSCATFHPGASSLPKRGNPAWCVWSSACRSSLSSGPTGVWRFRFRRHRGNARKLCPSPFQPCVELHQRLEQRFGRCEWEWLLGDGRELWPKVRLCAARGPTKSNRERLRSWEAI